MAEQAKHIGQRLALYLGEEFISYRTGEGGFSFAYIEGHEVVGLLNEIFGWNGWHSTLLDVQTLYSELSQSGKWSVGVKAVVRITVTSLVLSGGREVRREDIGVGKIENASSRGMAHEKSLKGAVTDATKRAAQLLGNATGGCLRDKDYLRQIKRVRTAGPKTRLVEADLYRKSTNRNDGRTVLPDRAAMPVAGGPLKAEEWDDEDTVELMGSDDFGMV